MGRVLAWIRANLAIVVLSAVIVLVLPAGWIGSSRWNASIRDRQEKAGSKALSDLKVTVNYRLPRLLPGEKEISLPGAAPNEALTSWFAEMLEARSAQTAEVARLAEERNRAGHDVLVHDLFPAPRSDREASIKTLELAERLVGTASRPSAYVDLLRAINAGEPATPGEVMEELVEIQHRELERIRAQQGTSDPTPEARAELNRLLVRHRIGEAQRRAREVSVYAGLDVVPIAAPGKSGGRPDRIPSPPPGIDLAFTWQFDYWVIADILSAVGRANTVDGRLVSVPEAVVKRIISIELEPLPIFGESTLVGRAGGRIPPPSRDQVVGTNVSASLTGRESGASNQVYDVRKVKAKLIVSSARLPALINAISGTNFMTVLDLDLSEIDPAHELSLGYYYGDEHVMQADVEIETIWLRSWTVALMPQGTRTNLAVHQEVIAAAEARAAPRDGG